MDLHIVFPQQRLLLQLSSAKLKLGKRGMLPDLNSMISHLHGIQTENISIFSRNAHSILWVMHFTLISDFPIATRPLLVALQKELRNPFLPATPPSEDEQG